MDEQPKNQQPANETDSQTVVKPANQQSENKLSQESSKPASGWRRFGHWYGSHKKWSVPLTLLLLVGILAAVPSTRYKIAGLVIKKNFTVEVVDATTHTPVSGAAVSSGSASAQTGNDGKAVLNLSAGQHMVSIAKNYYQNQQLSVLVPILSQKSTPSISLQATGRQVKIVVSNLINKQKLSNVEIGLAGSKSKTDKEGNAVVVVPAGTTSEKATLKLTGYNDAKVDVQASDQTIKENDFNLTPSGKIYFLSKLSGKIDVVKTNLDGTQRQTVLAGTGKEEERGTVLLASRDWKFLALLSRRDSSNPKLYLIDTATDKLSTIDEGDVNLELIGWANNSFIYTIHRNSVPNWKTGQEALKSFNALSKQIVLLDQAKGEGSASSNYAHESYGNGFVIDNNVVYEKHWSAYNSYSNPGKLANKRDGIYSIGIDGKNSRILKEFPHKNGSFYIYVTSFLYEPREIYYQVDLNDGSNPQFYEYSNGSVNKTSNLKDEFEQYYYDPNRITYLLSPSDNETFWSEERDGKNTLFIGNDDGKKAKQIATLSEYNPYGWYSDAYLLVSKNSSELYIMPRAGVSKDPEAIKISDYHKPKQNYYGYGGGYGGI